MKKLFAYRVEDQTIKKWKQYAQIKNITIENLGNTAINEYIKNHPITEQERKNFFNVNYEEV